MSKRPPATHLLMVVALTVLNVCCTPSRTWKDDPATWKRVFGGEQPPYAKVVHSWYWKSISGDSEYFFQLEPSDVYRKHLLSMNMMDPFTPDTKERKVEVQKFRHPKPSWFTPKNLESYEIWQGKPPHKTFRLFIDRETGKIFLSYFSP